MHVGILYLEYLGVGNATVLQCIAHSLVGIFVPAADEDHLQLVLEVALDYFFDEGQELQGYPPEADNRQTRQHPPHSQMVMNTGYQGKFHPLQRRYVQVACSIGNLDTKKVNKHAVGLVHPLANNAVASKLVGFFFSESMR